MNEHKILKMTKTLSTKHAQLSTWQTKISCTANWQTKQKNINANKPPPYKNGRLLVQSHLKQFRQLDVKNNGTTVSNKINHKTSHVNIGLKSFI